MKGVRAILTLLALYLSGGPGGRVAVAESHENLVRQVREAESAFAKTMADRDNKRLSIRDFFDGEICSKTDGFAQGRTLNGQRLSGNGGR